MTAIRCYACGEEKEESMFHLNKTTKTGRQSRCKSCDKKWHAERYVREKEKIRSQSKKWREENKERCANKSLDWKKNNPDKVKKYQRIANLRKSFGIEVHQYEEMLSKQGGVCAICGLKETFIHKKTNQAASLAVDHCHTTGVVRGLLCKSCNTALGHFKDNTDNLVSAIKYLELFNEKS